ncbi:MAG: M20 family peptidase [Bacteroidota bacterium]
MKKLFGYILIGILILFVVMVFKTMSYTSKQIKIDPVQLAPVDDAAIDRFSEGLQFQTVSKRDFVDTSAYEAYNRYLDATFALADSVLNKTYINQYSRYYEWLGKNSALAPILLIAHNDVVPVEAEVLDQWTEAPYSGLVKDGKIWGRGSLDDKNNVFSILEAVESLIREGYQPERSIYLAFGHDEEIGGANGASVMAKHFQDQGIQFEYVLDEGMMVLEGSVPGIEKPVGLIGIAEKGYLNLRLTANLQGGHSSMPLAETTIGVLGQAVANIQNHPMPGRLEGPVAEMFQYLGPEMSFPFKMVFANTWLTKGLLQQQLSNQPATNATLRTTSVPTIIHSGVKANVIPSEGYAIVNFRLKPGDTKEAVIEHIKKVVDDDRITIIPNDEEYRAASKVSATDAFGFNTIQKTIREVFPDAIVSPALVVAGTDSRHYEIVADQIYRFMPVQAKLEDIRGIHGIDEWISVENYKRSIQFYRQLILNSSK